MATRSVNKPEYGIGNRSIYARWDGLLNGDDGQPVQIDEYLLGSLQLLGTVGAGFNLNLQGSNELVPASYATIAAFSTITATGLVIPAAAALGVPVQVRHVRPIITAGDGTTNVSVILIGLRRS